jgi:hypothetical protein
MTVTFTGSTEVDLYRVRVLASALDMYAQHGIRVNKLWTPKRMMGLARSLAKRNFKPRDYEGAAKALRKIWDAEVERRLQAKAVADTFGQAL